MHDGSGTERFLEGGPKIAIHVQEFGMGALIATHQAQYVNPKPPKMAEDQYSPRELAEEQREDSAWAQEEGRNSPPIFEHSCGELGASLRPGP